jgi:hypothetical protein
MYVFTILMKIETDNKTKLEKRHVLRFNYMNYQIIPV